MSEGSRTCIYCQSNYEAGNNWDYVTCQECAKKLTDELNAILFGEILGYEDWSISAFFPELPKKPFRNASIAVIRGHRISEEPVDKKLLIQKFKEIATDIKNNLIKGGITPENRGCEICGDSYNADAIWPYTICKECAGKKYWDHREFWVMEAFGLDEDYVDLHPGVPKMDVSKYLLQKGTKMTPEDALRIQSHADKTNTNQDFKARAQAAAAKNIENSTE